MSQGRPSPQEIMNELERLRARGEQNLDQLALLHEISVYQEELIAQNDMLARMQATVEETRDRFIELYDFAPNGYLTLDEQGVIRQCNLTAAALFGRSKETLEGIPLLGFVEPDERASYFDFLRRCRSAGRLGCETELTVRTGNGSKCVQLLCRPRMSGARAEYLTSVIDVTDRKTLERDRQRIAREHAMLAGRLISVQDAERMRIARDLHDDIGQELTALRLTLELLAGETPAGTVSSGLTRAQQALERVDRRLHFVASELRPAALDLGIVAALDQFASQWSTMSGVPVTFHSGGITPGILEPDVETHLYRIAQEALNNVSKHAAASRVRIVLDRHGAVVELSVHDNGRGFDPAAERPGEVGLGLAGMRERAQLIGGRLTLDSGRRGTIVRLQLPAAGSNEVISPVEPARDDGGSVPGPTAGARAGTRRPTRGRRS